MERNNDNFIMLPTADFCFKELMRNDKVRKGFVAALLKISPEKVEKTLLLPTIMGRESETDKLGILDVRVLLTDGTQMDLEMQVTYFAYWDRRILYYLGRMYTGQLQKGDSYDKLGKCIHVSILDFVYFPDDDECYRTVHFRDDKTGEVYTDLMEIQILEIKKLPTELTDGEDILSWMRFFSGKSRDEFEHMAKTNEYWDEAYQELIQLSADEKKKLEYEAREKALKDYNTQMNSSFERGQKIGEELTKQVFKLHLQGKSPEAIAKATHISTEKVLQILE